MAYRPNVVLPNKDIYRDLDYALLPPSAEDYLLIVQNQDAETLEHKIRFADLIPTVVEAIFPNITRQVNTFYYTVTSQDIVNGYFDMGVIPINGQGVTIIPQGGIPQVFGIDFVLNGSIVLWNQLGLQPLVDVGSILMITVLTN